MPLEGQQIGRYRFLRLLGSGGMGNVYLAEDARIEQQVAVKVIRAEGALYPNAMTAQDGIRLFRREARAIARLDHPNILPLFDYGEERLGDTTVIYLVMPYRQEGSLASWLRQRPTSDLLSHQEVDHIVRQAAEALQHAHKRQIVHQDVKPSNFLLRQREDTPSLPDVLLADFGIARFMTAISSTGQSIRGTPTYMAPEQWEGEPVFATDQYALAVMTYELLTGRPPFQGGPGRMMYQHINTEPPPPSTFNTRLSPEVDEVLLHALAKKPEQRFASITAFADAFHQAVQDMQNEHAPTLSAPLKTPFSKDTNGAVPVINPVEETHPAASSAELDVSAPAESKEPTEMQPAAGASTSTQPAVDNVDMPVMEAVDISILEPGSSPENEDFERHFTDEAEPVQQNAEDEAQEEVTKVLEEGEPIDPFLKAASVPLTDESNIFTAHHRAKHRPLLVFALISLMLLLVFGSIAYAARGSFTFLPKNLVRTSLAGGTLSTVSSTASLATVMITPASTHLLQPYLISAVSGTPIVSQHQVKARLLSSITQTQTQTANATGQGTTPGTHASGIVAITNADPTSPITVSAGSVFANAYSTPIHMVVDATVTVPPAPSTTGVSQKTAPGHILEVGTIGNNTFDSNIRCNNGSKCWYVFNDPPFSNGKDPQTYTAVQQSDINNAANSLIKANTTDPQEVLQPQIQANERLVSTAQCKPNISSNHVAGDKATSVTVTVSFTCTGEVYDQNAAQAMAAGMLKAQASTDPGSGYALVGNVTTSVSSATVTDARNGTITLKVNAEGVWVYQFSAAQKLAMARVIAGKSESEAQTLLLEQRGMKQADIQIAGGNTLPTNTDQITFVVQSAPGI